MKNALKFLAPILLFTVIMPFGVAVAEPSAGMFGADQISAKVSAFASKWTPIAVEEKYVATVTAYNSEVGQTDSDPFIAANGKHVYDGMLACSRALPFGAKVTIGNRTYTCGDRKAQKYDDATNLALPLPEFDIWMTHKSDALAWGRRTMEVTVTYKVN